MKTLDSWVCVSPRINTAPHNRLHKGEMRGVCMRACVRTCVCWRRESGGSKGREEGRKAAKREGWEWEGEEGKDVLD